MTGTAGFAIETLLAEHWPGVARVYAEGIATRNATFETEVPTWEEWDSSHLANHRFVAQEDGDLVGWVAVSGETAEQVSGHELARRLEFGKRRGFGSVKVEASIGGSRWKTSLFPRKSGDGWFLPVKKSVRIAEGLIEGDEIEVELELL